MNYMNNLIANIEILENHVDTLPLVRELTVEVQALIAAVRESAADAIETFEETTSTAHGIQLEMSNKLWDIDYAMNHDCESFEDPEQVLAMVEHITQATTDIEGCVEEIADIANIETHQLTPMEANSR